MRNTYNTCIPLVAHYVSEPLRGSELLLCYRPHPRLHSLRSLSLGLLKSVPLRGTAGCDCLTYILSLHSLTLPKQAASVSRGGFYPHPPSATVIYSLERLTFQ